MQNATTHHHGQARVEELCSPEMVKQSRLLQRNLHDYEEYLDNLRFNLGEIQTSVSKAHAITLCLLANDPFEAWEARKRKDRGDAINAPPEGNSKKLTAPEMRQEVVRVKRLLELFVVSLRGFFYCLENNKAFDNAQSLAGKVLADNPLELCKTKKQLGWEAWLAEELADYEKGEELHGFLNNGEEPRKFDNLD